MNREHLARFLASCIFVVLTSCGGGGGGGSSAPLPPVPSATASVLSGTAPLTVNFDASKSTDPQGYPLTFAWTFGDGTAMGSGATTSHTYQDHGTYTATVAVSDGHNTATSPPIAITVAPAPPTVQPVAIPVNVMGVAPTITNAQVMATDRENLTLTYAITTPPTVGTATINASTGAIVYTVSGFVTPGVTSDAFTVTVSNPGAQTPSNVAVALNADPLLANQWHVQNTGQDAFSSTFPVAGNDMDVTGAWTAGYSGKGIKVGVADSGLEAAHEDLAANVDLAHSVNFLTGGNDPTPTVAGPDHGTMVSGIIGAVAFNGKGGRGVAYNATLRGYNLVATGAFSVANMATALGDAAISSDNDIFNASFGLVGNAIPTFSGSYQSIALNSLTLRGGLGASIVNAAGNDFLDFEVGSSPLCQVARQYGVSCGDPATDERRGGDTPIIVGALDATGTHAVYSSAGSALWISAPGGEYGLNQNTLTAAENAGLPDPLHDYMPAIVTSAHTGCANAQNPFVLASPIAINPLDDLGANPLAANCQYTAAMNGTSSATPNTTGTIALMLEANPKLSVRDIKYILAKTAQHVDPTFAGVSSTTILSGSTVVLEQGWTTNAGGFPFANRYGFGGVDTAAAVAMAKTYTSYLPALVNSTGNYNFVAAPPATIPPASAAGAFLTYSVSEAFQTVEFVVVFVNIATTPGAPCNQIELTSPSGTKSILMHAANGFTNAAFVNSRFESNAFYGEPANGTWTLRFIDLCAPSGTSTTLSTAQPQTLLLAGH